MKKAITVTITAKVTATVELEEDETVDEFVNNRFVDIYLQDRNRIDKQDLGTDECEITAHDYTLFT